MFITADQLLAHAIGDYILQSDWMALKKTQRMLPALVHAAYYTMSFAFLTRSIWALLFIASTHFVIDRWRLARYVVWAKNFIAPKWIPDLVAAPDPSGDPDLLSLQSSGTRIRNYPWSECSMTGYHNSRPPFLAVWLLIIADNIMHVLCNGLALRYL